jgi:hypothetical protein
MSSYKHEHLTVIEAVSIGLVEYESEKDAGKNDSIRADQALKFCPECKKIWELEYGQKKHRQFSYSHIPKIGKGECQCPECRFVAGEKFYVAWPNGSETRMPINSLDCRIDLGKKINN